MDRIKLSWVLVVLIAGVLIFSCDLFGDDEDDAFDDWVSKEKGIIIERDAGGALTYGQTYVDPDDVPSTM